MKHFSPQEAGEYLGPEGHPIPVATLQWWRHKGRGPKYLKIGRRVMYAQKDLDDFLSSCAQNPEHA